MNHIYTTTKATILFVEVPEDAIDIVCDKNVLYYRAKWAIFDKIGQAKKIDEGTWQFITLLKDAREEQAVNVVDSIFDKYYMDYENPNNNTYAPGYTFDTALESLHSLATSLGVKGNAAVLVKVSV